MREQHKIQERRTNFSCCTHSSKIHWLHWIPCYRISFCLQKEILSQKGTSSKKYKADIKSEMDFFEKIQSRYLSNVVIKYTLPIPNIQDFLSLLYKRCCQCKCPKMRKTRKMTRSQEFAGTRDKVSANLLVCSLI